MQMVSLYKDPKGENVFKSNLGSQDTGITLATSKLAVQYNFWTTVISIIRLSKNTRCMERCPNGCPCNIIKF